MLLLTMAPILCLLLFPFGDGSTVETLDQSYVEYVSGYKAAPFDPVGAAGIFHRTFSTRDSYDEWWRFHISETRFHDLVSRVAKANRGPDVTAVKKFESLPIHWRTSADAPDWWDVENRDGLQSIHWCFKSGGAERHHAWLFVYDSDAGIAWCWHWNHQWAASECP